MINSIDRDFTTTFYFSEGTMELRKSRILSVIVAATGESICIGENELNHALQKHFRIPKIKLLEVVEQVLLDPTLIFIEENKDNKTNVKAYYLFYRLDDGGYLVVVVKKLVQGNFF
mgnify:CR=1 FL=1